MPQLINLFNRIATSPELGGLLSDSGFLEAMYLSDLNSRTPNDLGKNDLANIDLGCKTVALYSSLTSGLSLCPCQLAGHGIGNGYKIIIRVQQCCDYWMGRAQQGEDKSKNFCEWHSHEP